MGYAKYYEDDQKIIDDRRFLLGEHDFIKNTNVSPPIIICPYCNSFFQDKSKLFDHIKGCHGELSRLLLLNRQVAQKVSHVGKIMSVVVVRHDLSEPILINSKPVLCNAQESDITESVQNEIQKSNKVDICVGDRAWEIAILRREEMHSDKLEAVRSDWDMKTKDYQQNRKFIEKFQDSDFNNFEKRCLNGFYNYYIACVAETSLKESRYEDALNLLSEFEQLVPAAKVILKLIAFRFNWADRLRMLCAKEDLFTNIWEFFFGLKSDTIYSFVGDKEIYIEDDLENSLQAILDYQSEKYDRVDEYLRGFGQETLMNMKDSNAKDRIYLLKARRAASVGKKHDAVRYYDEIKAPFFEAERRRFVKN